MILVLLSTIVALLPLGLIAIYILLRLFPLPKRTMEFMVRERVKYGTDKAFYSLFNKNAKSLAELTPTPAKCYLSVVIPAMNEETRLPVMLDDCLTYLKKRARDDKSFSYEIIVVDDGSRDATSDVALAYYNNGENVSVLKLDRNMGKGGAVRSGVLCTSGRLILFADADGATTFSELAKLEDRAKQICGADDPQHTDLVVVGSRAHLEDESIASRSVLRTILMVGFHCLVRLLAVRGVRDTQCGFKLFSRKSAAKLFPRLHVERWAFDVELLYLVERLGIAHSEVAVEWREVDGSKITPLYASMEMGRDILLIWCRYSLGLWHLQDLQV